MDPSEVEARRLVEERIKAAKSLTTYGPMKGWRWFLDGEWICLEPPSEDTIMYEEIRTVAASYGIDRSSVRAQYRELPRVGVYLVFKLARGQ